MRSKEAFAYSRITGYFCSVVNVRVSGSSKRPDPLGKAGRGLPRRTWGDGARHDQTDQCSTFSALGSMEGPPAGFYLFVGGVHLSHTERRLSLSHFLDNALHFLDNASHFFGRPPVALVSFVLWDSVRAP
jgi:hypothetical protein